MFRALLAIGLALAAFQPHAADAEDPRALLRGAEALQRDGQRDLALRDLERARALAEAGNDAALLASVRGALGKAYLLTGRREEARKLLEDALAAANAAGDAPLAAAALNDLGILAAIEERGADAALAYGRSVAAARQAGVPLAAARASTNLARLRLKEGDAAGARAALDEAGRALEAVADPRARMAQRMAVADVQEKLRGGAGDAALAARLYDTYSGAAALAGGTGDLRSLALARGGLARLYAAGRRHGEALDLARLALAAAQAGGAEDTLYRWHWLAAHELAALGRTDEALAAYRRALQSFQSVRADLILELRALNESYRDAVAPLYLETADLMLRRARQAAGGAAQAQLLEVRDLLEQFKSVELEDYFQDECVARLQAREKAIDAVSARTAILYPVVLPDRVEVLLSLAGGMKQVLLGVDAARFTAEIHEFRARLEKRTTREYLPLARSLYEEFFKPLEADLAAARVDTVVLVPDGALRGIPLAALHDGTDFLVARYAFATAPGLTLLEPRPLQRQDERVLLGGLSEGVQKFPALPYVTEELASIQRLTGGIELSNAQFLVGSLEQQLQAQPYSMVHIATHAHFDRDPKQSFLLAWDGKLDMDGLERAVKRTRFRDNAVELLTLSACQTAAGDDRAALGLAGIAIKAGARSALATLWFINDQASSTLVTDFYARLAQPGMSKVKALQAAQRDLIADPRYRHPGYWSPFLLIGNWL